MELKNDSIALLDEVQIYRFTIRNFVDFDALQAAGIITVKENMANYFLTASGRRYSSVHIKDDDTGMFTELVYALGLEGQAKASVIMSVPDDGYHNLNCLTPEEYKNRIVKLQEHLMERYGIDADFTDAGYRQIEINKTIILNGAFDDYRRPLKLMIHSLPGTLRLGGEHYFGDSDKAVKITDRQENIKAYARHSGNGKKGLSIKIYDKTNQLFDSCKINVNYNYLRFEITLKSQVKIEQCLGTNRIDKLTEKDINRYFSEFVETNIVQPYEKYKKQRAAEIKKTLKKHYRPLSRTWVQDALLEISRKENNTGIPVLLDVEELIPVLDEIKMTRPDARRNARRRFRDVYRRAEMASSPNRDDLKYVELIHKLR